MATTNVTIRMDEELKKQADDLFSDLGLSMTAALIAFTKQAVKEQRIPFVISRNVPNAETICAINEVDKMKRNPEIYKGYDDIDEMMTNMEDEFDLKVIAEYESDPDKKTYSHEEVKNMLKIN